MMIVTCPRCLTKFNLPDDKLISGTQLNLRCSRCGSEFLSSPQHPDDKQDSTKEPYLPVPEKLESEVGVETTDPVVFDDKSDSASFESIDDFADAEDFLFDEPTDFQEDSGITEKVESKEEVQKSAELALDIDDLDIVDLDIDDIEFDSFEDELDSVGGLDDQTNLQKECQTQLDDDGDLDNLIKQVEELPSDSSASIIAKENGEQTEAEASEKSSDASLTHVGSPKVVGRKRSFILVLSCFAVLGLALCVAFGLWQHFSVDMTKHLRLVEVKNKRLRLPSERIVIVLQGKVVNSSNKLVTDLKIKGILLDKAGKTVAKVVTPGGVSFSEEELDLPNARKLMRPKNNPTTLPPNGGELPFMIAFYDYPERARKCYVELSSFKVK